MKIEGLELKPADDGGVTVTIYDSPTENATVIRSFHLTPEQWGVLLEDLNGA